MNTPTNKQVSSIRVFILWLGTLCLVGVLLVCPISAFGVESNTSAQSDNSSNSSETSSTETDTTSLDGYNVQVSAEGEQALIEQTPYAANSFSRSNKGTNRAIDGVYRGYTYIQPQANMAVLIDMDSFVVVYIPPEQLEALGLSLESEEDTAPIQALLQTLDNFNADGNPEIDENAPWYFTSEEAFSINDVVFSFNQPVNDRYYSFVIGADGSDITETASEANFKLNHASFASLSSSEEVAIEQAPSGISALAAFLQNLDFSPLWVTLKTTITATVIIFILGILAAWFSLRLPDKWQNIVDVVFTIPMVLPPTVCGFILLLALGSNSPIGQWFNAIGFPLIFSWQATVIAAVVVAFPLMYRSARGAFENLNPDMLDAARTLGWNESRIFFKLMLPLAWSSIAAGTMLAFARALGEFGATLFLAGNYVGITRTIPIAIYFEWMGGNTDVAIFWTLVVIILSFIVIFALNVWSKHTTRYRRKEVSDELER